MNQTKLKFVLDYDPDTGVFTNRITRGPNAPAGAVAGSEDVHGYWTIWSWGKAHKAHRLAWLYMTGEWPKGDIDHINGAKGDNRFENLRDVPRSVNVSNAAIEGWINANHN